MAKVSFDTFWQAAKKGLRPEIVFPVLAMTAGLCMVFVNAPFQAPDEASHFWRAYHVYKGNFISTKQGNLSGGMIPKSVAQAHLPFEYLVGKNENRVEPHVIANGLKESFNKHDRIFVGMGFAALYSPVVYLPQVTGIAIGRILGLSALGMMYSARIMNLLFWIVVTTAAIRITPVFKWVFLLVALLPMNMFLAASLSADAPADGVTSLLLALVLWALWKKDTLHWPHLLAIGVSCVLLAFIKLPYVPLAGLILLIPASRFSGLKNKQFFCAIVFALILAGVWVWSSAIKDLYTPIHGANAPEQLTIVKEHPWEFVEVLADTVQKHWRGYVVSFIGLLGFLDTPLPNWVYLSYPLVLMVTALFDRGLGELLGVKQRLWIIAICLGVSVLIALSMYLTWTPPGEKIIEGIQGRYFLPLAVPGLLAVFYNRKWEFPAGSLGPLLIAGYSVSVLIMTCLCLYDRYFAAVS